MADLSAKRRSARTVSLNVQPSQARLLCGQARRFCPRAKESSARGGADPKSLDVTGGPSGLYFGSVPLVRKLDLGIDQGRALLAAKPTAIRKM